LNEKLREYQNESNVTVAPESIKPDIAIEQPEIELKTKYQELLLLSHSKACRALEIRVV
jgi:hypothetical protein